MAKRIAGKKGFNVFVLFDFILLLSAVKMAFTFSVGMNWLSRGITMTLMFVIGLF